MQPKLYFQEVEAFSNCPHMVVMRESLASDGVSTVAYAVISASPNHSRYAATTRWHRTIDLAYDEHMAIHE